MLQLNTLSESINQRNGILFVMEPKIENLETVLQNLSVCKSLLTLLADTNLDELIFLFCVLLILLPFYFAVILLLEPKKVFNQFHNILRLFDVLPNFAFTTCETMGCYYL